MRVTSRLSGMASRASRSATACSNEPHAWGGHAEYKVISEKRMVATIPPAISYESGGEYRGAHYALTYVRALRVGRGRCSCTARPARLARLRRSC